MIMTAARTANIDHQDTMIVKKTTTTATVMIEEAGATERVVHQLIRSIAAVAAIKTSTARHARTETAAESIAAAIALDRLLKKASTTMTLMRMVTESQNRGRDASTGVTKTGIVIGLATRIASEIGVTAKTGTKTTTMSVSVRRID
jgi:RNA-binding protein YhbY